MANSNKSFSVVTLGGTGEIGMNCIAVEFEGRILLIDCGVMFMPETLGIDLIHPDFEYLASRRDDVEAVVITHGHEDHLAGIPFLLREIDVPVYCSPYALGLLEKRITDYSPAPRLVAKSFAPGDKVELGPFVVQSFSMPHSIVENTGLVIDTPAGRLLHTGDFKLGMLGPDKGNDVLSRLKDHSQGKVDLMLADVTGSEEEEIAGQESTVEVAIEKLVSNATQRVFVAIFSSNVQRLESIMKVAARCQRKVALCGRSVQTHARVAEASGNLHPPPRTIIPLEDAMDLPPEDVLVVISGTQGETRSALGRLADDSHRAVHADRDDLVIMSSRFIPGNELAIAQVIDKLGRLGVQVVHRGKNSDVHVSGHGSRTEIIEAIKAVSPRCFMPIHGTYRHLVSGAELARKIGVKNVITSNNGVVVRCNQQGLQEVGRTPVGRVYIDGGSGLTEAALKDRRVLGANGVLVATFNVDNEGFVAGDVNVIARGVIKSEAVPWLAEQVGEEIKRRIQLQSPADRQDKSRCSEIIRLALRKFLSNSISREPYVLVSIMDSQ